MRRNQVGLRVAINEIANELAARPACMSRTRSDKEMSEISLVRFDNIVLRFGDTTILDGINLKIWIRDRLGILGQSGSGKSTMLRLTVGRAGRKIARRDRGDGQRKIDIGRDGICRA